MRYKTPILVAALVLGSSTAAMAQQQAHDLEEVVVTANPLSQSPLDSSQPVSVISSDELTRSQSANIGEALENAAGISSASFGPGVGRPVIRGLTGSRVRVLEDTIGSLDVSSLSPDHAVGIEPLFADQIEIFRGPATLLYGSGALGGVVNVELNRIPDHVPADALSGAVEVRGDTATDERTVAARLDGGQRNLAWHVDALTRETGDIEIPGFATIESLRANDEVPGKLVNSFTETTSGAGGFSIHADNRFIGASVSVFESEYGLPGPEPQDEVEPGEPEEEGAFIDLEQTRIDVNSEFTGFGNGIEAIRFRLGQNDYQHAEIEGGVVGTLFENDALEARIELIHAPVAGWRGVFGVQHQGRDFAAIGDEAFVPGTQTQSVALFIVEERQFNDWRFDIGGRVETLEHEPDGENPAYDESAFALSAGAHWHLAGEAVLAVSMAIAQRHPDTEELYSDGPHVATRSFEIGPVAEGQPLFDVETSNAIDVSLRGEGPVSWNVTAFLSRIDDFVFQQRTGDEQDGFPVLAYRQDDARFYGFEAEIGIPVIDNANGRLELGLISDFTYGELNDGDGAYVPRLPPLRLGGTLDYARGDWQVGLRVMQYGDQDRTSAFERPTAGYTMVDADVNYSTALGTGLATFFLRGTNLLDEDARRSTSFLKEFAPQPGLSVHAGARVEF